MLTDRVHDEAGVALVTALLATIILGGVAVVLLASAMTNLQVTASAREHDDAIHTAETGADLVVEAMNEDRDHSTGHSNPVDPVREWAVDKALDAYVDAEQRSLDGDLEPHEAWHEGHFSYGIRGPQGPDEEDRVYGVGIVEGREQHVRVVLYSITDEPFRPEHAVLTEGSLEISGGPKITGAAGGVHTNNELEMSGNVEIEKTATSSSDVCSAGNNVSIDGGDGDCESGHRPRNIPEMRARDFYDSHGDHDEWYDLCEDGVVRLPSSAGPCEGADEGSGLPFKGWSFDGTDSWTRPGSGSATGVFYVHHANVKITGKQTFSDVTVLIEADLSGPGDDSGNISVGGGTRDWSPYHDQLAILADRDVITAGNSEFDSGAIIAGEQIRFRGNLGSEGGGSNGVIIAQDLEHESTWVESNSIGGNIHVNYDGAMTIPVADGLRVGSWYELTE